MNTLHILDPSGDLTLTWKPEDADSLARARAEVQRLKEAGYAFFLVDGTPADEVAAGRGTLNCRPISAEELTTADNEPTAPDEEPAPKRGGRPRRSEPVEAVAVRPLRGG